MKRRFLVFSIVLLLSISLFAFSSLAATADELLGEWFVNPSFIGSHYGFTVTGQFEFPYLDLDAYENDVGSREVNAIKLAVNTDDSIVFYGELLLSDSLSSLGDNLHYLVCSFEINDLSGGEWEEFELLDLSFYGDNSLETISELNIISLDDSDLFEFGVFISNNYHRAPVPPTAPDPSPYDAIYDLIKFWIFGDNVVAGSYHDLVCIQLSTIAVLLFFSIPFIVVFWLIRRVC